MAYITKSGGRYCVFQGNTGKMLKCFSGSDAKMKADKYLSALHRKNKPKSSNRGKSAKKKNMK